jgi:hypothetical protein
METAIAILIAKNVAADVGEKTAGWEVEVPTGPTMTAALGLAKILTRGLGITPSLTLTE